MPDGAEKIKIVCYIQNGVYQEDFFINGIENLPADLRMRQLAEKFFHSFSPKALTEKLSAHYEKDGFVLVFRTDSSAMEFFDVLLRSFEEKNPEIPLTIPAECDTL